MRQGRYADMKPIASRNVSTQLQTHLREEVRLFSDKTIALSGDLSISRSSRPAQNIRNGLSHFSSENSVMFAYGIYRERFARLPAATWLCAGLPGSVQKTIDTIRELVR